ncbi:hypothetical protein [Baekduia sp. Peel2402]|uniref:hypothetical protein n=1 Tax=Baekduia sp. Peel2402 TaxID=3458296 RepID=UPI00403EC525
MRIRLQVLSIGLAAALAVSGCGAEESAKKAASGAKNALDPVAQAAETTSAQKGGIAMTMKGSVNAAGQDVPLEGSGKVDRSGKKGTFSFTTSISGKSVKMDEIIDNKIVYIGSDLFAGLPGGKRWVKVDISAEASKLGIDLGSLGAGTTQDPAAALDYLKGAGESREVGTATINGTKTTQYHVDVDLRKVAAKSGDDEAKKGVEKLIQMTGTATIPVDVWVDDQHLVRREKLAYDTTVQGQKSSFDFTIDITKYGIDVDAKAPPADQVADFADVLGGAGTTNG